MKNLQQVAGEQYLLKEEPYVHFIKYMGSKSKIMGFVLEGLNEVYRGGAVCDLFAGSASISGAIGKQVPIHSNDIQVYSSVLADAYLNVYKHPSFPESTRILKQAGEIVEGTKQKLNLHADYQNAISLEKFNELEKLQQDLINVEFSNDWHLFTKCYSGTWWSAEQCLWIDAIREISEQYRESPCYHLIIATLMYAMAYTSQGTGHYAQYRDANTESSMKDILIYRRRSVADYFKRKYDSVAIGLPAVQPSFTHRITSMDFRECLKNFEGGTIYADPPYCFVHYSRFYHALETLVLYDYPNLQVKGGKVVKGRYRENRHQSPFCIRTQVKEAFRDLFEGVNQSQSNLVLSYSNTGMITIDEIGELADEYFPGKEMEILTTDHQHMTLGRQKDRHRDVEECLLLVKQ